MKKVVIGSFVVLGLLGLQSCKVMKSTTTTPRTIESYETKILIKPLVAEVEVNVSKKITGTATIKTGKVEDAKELAKWNALEASGADIIVDPVYKVTVQGMIVTAEVTGFFGKYTKISTVEDEDIEKLDYYTVPNNSNGDGKGSVVTKLKKLKNTK